MSLWTAADVSLQLADLRKKAQQLNQSFALDETAFSLPQHISLKISCRLDDAQTERACDEISALFAAQQPMLVHPEAIARHQNILWLTFQESDRLSLIHRQLDELLLQKFNVPQHLFDTCFQFHSTLFMDDRTEELDRMQQKLSDFPLPPVLCIRDYLIGCSENGKPGTYRVISKFHA